MHAEIRYLLQLMRAFVQRESAPPIPVDMDMKRLFHLAQSSNLSGLVGYMLLPMPSDDAVVAAFQKHFFQTVGIFANRNDAVETLRKQLDAAGIPFALLKGAVVSRLYPARELRTFGDVDVYVPPVCRTPLTNLLKAQGDEICYEDATQICISRLPLQVEFHFNLTADCGEDNPALYAYLNDPTPCMCQDEMLDIQTVDPVYHFVYLLSHQLRHLQGDSPGIRSYLDLAVVLQSGYLTDYAALRETLQTVGLYAYAQKALTLTERWFRVPSPLPTVAFSDEDVSFIEEYLFRVGQFARKENPRAASVQAKGGKCPRLRAVLTALFPPAARLREDKRYRSLAKRCLPLAYIYRLFRGAFCRTGYALSSAKDIATATEDAAARHRVQSIMGGIEHEER